MINIESSVITYIGLVRESNEDNYFLNGKFKSDSSIEIEGYTDKQQRDSYLYAVCDGMGGERHGEVASLIAVETLEEYQMTNIRKTVMEYIQRANRLICDEIDKNGGSRIGTTLALLYIRNNKAIAYNIGDSRVYFLRDGDLYLLSEDHTEAQRLVKTGQLTEDEAVNHVTKNKLTQHLGLFPDEMFVLPYVSVEIDLMKDDIFMICSDGLTDMVSDDEIAEILSTEGKDSTDLVKIMATTVQASGGRDNATFIVIKAS